MRRLSICLAVSVAVLVVAPAALADGPIFITQGGTGVASYGHPALHYVAISDRAGGTMLETIDAAHRGVFGWARLHGSWGIPSIGNGYSSGQGLSRNGRTLVLGTVGSPYVSSSKFLVVDTRKLKAVRTIELHGNFIFDALSPDASKLYLIQFTSAGDLSHYIVREYDMQTNRLLPGKIAARSDDNEKSMSGYAMTRTTSAGGRWVYTLYQKPSGEPFVHALDTVRGVAYCIDLPANKSLYNIVLSMRDRDRTLAVHWRSGRPWLNVAVGTWEVSAAGVSGFPWAWVGAAIAAALALLAAAALLLRRRRGEELEQHPRQELGLT